jgi:uncharacterized cofD-like protein
VSISNQKIVCIGGGTGTFVVLRGLKYFPYHLSAIVTMSDSGGSNKRLRDEFGLLPTSDIRQCLVALSEENGGIGLLRKLFMYRFEKGEGLSGMTFGNLFMAALTDILGSQEEAIRQTGKVLRVHGTVIPVSFTAADLYATYEDGHQVKEEHLIDEPPHDGRLKIVDIRLKPKAKANPEALKAIKEASLIVLGPGDLYTSLIPNLLVEDIAFTIKNSQAKVVYVMNLMTKFGQTYNFKASDHLEVLEKFLDRSIDFVLLNTSHLSKSALEAYAKISEVPVIDDLLKKAYYQVVRTDVASRAIFKKSQSDHLVRSLIRHDSHRLAATLVNILKGGER